MTTKQPTKKAPAKAGAAAKRTTKRAPAKTEAAAPWAVGSLVMDSFPDAAVQEVIAKHAPVVDRAQFSAFLRGQLDLCRSLRDHADSMPEAAGEYAYVDALLAYVDAVRDRLTKLPPRADCLVLSTGHRLGVLDTVNRLPTELADLSRVLHGAMSELEGGMNQRGRPTSSVRDRLLKSTYDWLRQNGAPTKIAAIRCVKAVLPAAGFPVPADEKDVQKLLNALEAGEGK